MFVDGRKHPQTCTGHDPLLGHGGSRSTGNDDSVPTLVFRRPDGHLAKYGCPACNWQGIMTSIYDHAEVVHGARASLGDR